jgi:hypothetical protein
MQNTGSKGVHNVHQVGLCGRFVGKFWQLPAGKFFHARFIGKSCSCQSDVPLMSIG